MLGREAMDVPRTLETGRLRLRPPTMVDASRILAEYAQDPEVTRYLTWRPHASVETTRIFLQRCVAAWERGTAFPWVITARADGRVLGMIELRVDAHRPDLLEEAGAVVSTCCLKTHRFGGQFTLSLKNSVGAVAKYGPDGYNYMGELHGSAAQRKMIAELNLLYRPAVVVLDGLEAFVSGGPEAGTRATPGLMIAGTDRVAVDAVGVAVLRLHGTTRAVSAGRIFEQEQIARAVELGLGVSRPEEITLLTDDAEGRAALARLDPVLRQG
jgi:hypothetical protein